MPSFCAADRTLPLSIIATSLRCEFHERQQPALLGGSKNTVGISSDLLVAPSGRTRKFVCEKWCYSDNLDKLGRITTILGEQNECTSDTCHVIISAFYVRGVRIGGFCARHEQPIPQPPFTGKVSLAVNFARTLHRYQQPLTPGWHPHAQEHLSIGGFR